MICQLTKMPLECFIHLCICDTLNEDVNVIAFRRLSRLSYIFEDIVATSKDYVGISVLELFGEWIRSPSSIWMSTDRRKDRSAKNITESGHLEIIARHRVLLKFSDVKRALPHLYKLSYTWDFAQLRSAHIAHLICISFFKFY